MKSIANLLLLFIVVGAMSCQQPPKADKATVSEATKVSKSKSPAESKSGVAFTNYVINQKSSRVGFTGTKPVGKHSGYFLLDGGSLSTFGSELKGGNFSIDINSMVIVDAMPVETANMLKGHLLSKDFFKPAQFPKATFNITGVSELKGRKVQLAGATHLLQGNLRLLDVTKAIEFPAAIKIEGKKFSASSEFNINRADFGMVYGNDQSLGDKFINPVVNLQLNIVAEAK